MTRGDDYDDADAECVKDIVILLDVSDSMTGLSRDIANHVVLTILESLSDNDFVTVLAFSEQTSPVVECLEDEDGHLTLVQVIPMPCIHHAILDCVVQATPGNIQHLSEAVARIEHGGTQNISYSLGQAFQTLTRYRRSRKVRCVQECVLSCLKYHRMSQAGTELCQAQHFLS